MITIMINNNNNNDNNNNINNNNKNRTIISDNTSLIHYLTNCAATKMDSALEPPATSLASACSPG